MQPVKKKPSELIRENAETSSQQESNFPIWNSSYAIELRALGQAIENHEFSSLNLELESGIYIVRGTVKASKKTRSSFSRFVRDLISSALSAPYAIKSAGEIDLRYTPEEIEKLEVEGRSKRQTSDRTPDPHDLSQILRSAGFYLDSHARLSLVGLKIKDPWVTLRYKTSEGLLEEAQQHLEYFYDYWVNMYLRRSNRPNLPPPRTPSLIVTWEGKKKQNPTY